MYGAAVDVAFIKNDPLSLPQVVPLVFVIFAVKQSDISTLMNNSLFCIPKESFNLKTYVPPVNTVKVIDDACLCR